jgi:hypothetical protein
MLQGGGGGGSSLVGGGYVPGAATYGGGAMPGSGGFSPGFQSPGGIPQMNRGGGYGGPPGFGQGVYQGNGQEFFNPANTTAAGLTQGLDAAQGTLAAMQNPQVNPALDAYSRQIGQQFREQVLPGIEGGANLAGARGSSRQGIAEGLAGSRTAQQIQDFAAQVYSGDQNRRLQAALGAGQLGQAGGQLQGQMAPLQSALAFSAPWFNLQAMQGIIGSPIMQDLGGKSRSSSESSNFGYGAHHESSSSVSESTGGGGGGGWNIGLGSLIPN